MPSKQDNNFRSLSEAYRKMAPYLNIGLSMALTMLAGVVAGYYLDKKFDTMPMFIIIGSVLGSVIAFINFFRTVRLLK